MKVASKDIKEKGIKTSHLKELSEMGVKLPKNSGHAVGPGEPEQECMSLGRGGRPPRRAHR